MGDVGYSFWKLFDDGWFEGKVTEIRPRAAGGKDRRCVYDDGDSEDLSLAQLCALLEEEQKPQARAAIRKVQAKKKQSKTRSLPTSTKKKKKQQKQSEKPLFAFSAPQNNSRLRKAIDRFETQDWDKKAKEARRREREGTNVKAGYGFPCPQCSAVCGLVARECDACGLECYYEAAVGVVMLQERKENDGEAGRNEEREETEEGANNARGNLRGGNRRGGHRRRVEQAEEDEDAAMLAAEAAATGEAAPGEDEDAAYLAAEDAAAAPAAPAEEPRPPKSDVIAALQITDWSNANSGGEEDDRMPAARREGATSPDELVRGNDNALDANERTRVQTNDSMLDDEGGNSLAASKEEDSGGGGGDVDFDVVALLLSLDGNGTTSASDRRRLSPPAPAEQPAVDGSETSNAVLTEDKVQESADSTADSRVEVAAARQADEARAHTAAGAHARAEAHAREAEAREVAASAPERPETYPEVAEDEAEEEGSLFARRVHCAVVFGIVMVLAGFSFGAISFGNEAGSTIVRKPSTNEVSKRAPGVVWLESLVSTSLIEEMEAAEDAGAIMDGAAVPEKSETMTARDVPGTTADAPGASTQVATGPEIAATEEGPVLNTAWDEMEEGACKTLHGLCGSAKGFQPDERVDTGAATDGIEGPKHHARELREHEASEAAATEPHHEEDAYGASRVMNPEGSGECRLLHDIWVPSFGDSNHKDDEGGSNDRPVSKPGIEEEGGRGEEMAIDVKGLKEASSSATNKNDAAADEVLLENGDDAASKVDNKSDSAANKVVLVNGGTVVKGEMLLDNGASKDRAEMTVLENGHAMEENEGVVVGMNAKPVSEVKEGEEGRVKKSTHNESKVGQAVEAQLNHQISDEGVAAPASSHANGAGETVEDGVTNEPKRFKSDIRAMDVVMLSMLVAILVCCLVSIWMELTKRGDDWKSMGYGTTRQYAMGLMEPVDARRGVRHDWESMGYDTARQERVDGSEDDAGEAETKPSDASKNASKDAPKNASENDPVDSAEKEAADEATEVEIDEDAEEQSKQEAIAKDSAKEEKGGDGEKGGSGDEEKGASKSKDKASKDEASKDESKGAAGEEGEASKDEAKGEAEAEADGAFEAAEAAHQEKAAVASADAVDGAKESVASDDGGEEPAAEAAPEPEGSADEEAGETLAGAGGGGEGTANCGEDMAGEGSADRKEGLEAEGEAKGEDAPETSEDCNDAAPEELDPKDPEGVADGAPAAEPDLAEEEAEEPKEGVKSGTAGGVNEGESIPEGNEEKLPPKNHRKHRSNWSRGLCATGLRVRMG